MHVVRERITLPTIVDCYDVYLASTLQKSQRRAMQRQLQAAEQRIPIICPNDDTFHRNCVTPVHRYCSVGKHRCECGSNSMAPGRLCYSRRKCPLLLSRPSPRTNEPQIADR